MCFKEEFDKWEGGQTILFSKVSSRGKKELACGSYNEENARRELALMIYDYIAWIFAFNSGPYRAYKIYGSTKPLFQLPSRNTMQK